MDQTKNQSSTEAEVHDKACHDKHTKRHMVALVTLLFLLGGMSALGALYYSSAETVSNKNDEIVSLQEEVSQLKVLNKESGTEELEDTSADTIDTSTNDAQASVYKSADSSAFELSLDAPYSISINSLNKGVFDLVVSEETKQLGENVSSRVAVLNFKDGVTNGGPGSLEVVIEEFETGFSTPDVFEKNEDIKVGSISATVYSVRDLPSRTVAFIEDARGSIYRIDAFNDADQGREVIGLIMSGLTFTAE